MSPSTWTNSDFPTEIVYWSRVTLCNLHYFIPRFLPMDVFPSRSMFSWNRSVENQLHLNLFFVFIMALRRRCSQFYRPFVKKWCPCYNLKTPQHSHLFGNVVKDITYRSSSNFIMRDILHFQVSAMVPDIYFMALLLVGRAFVS